MQPIWIVYLCGLHSLGFAVFHALFWRIFNWKNDLKASSVPTRAIVQIANVQLIHVFLFSALLCFLFPDDLVNTTIGRAFLIGMALFWVWRTVGQFIFLPYNKPVLHWLTALFVLGFVLFTLPLVVAQ